MALEVGSQEPNICFMPDGSEITEIRVYSSLAELSPEEWDACAGSHDPFVSHGFLSALEESGAVSAESGWSPRHLAIRDEAGKLLACAPLYLKNHSYGEYVFDWGWAEAYGRAGGSYYPKLQCAVPFTPATGPRLLVRDDVANQTHLTETLVQGMITLADQIKVSSLHITFPDKAQWNLLGGQGLMQRIGEQFHWKNRDYKTFDDFLADLSSRKRKAIKKERRKVAESNLVIHHLQGDAIKPEHWDAFFRFYMDTSEKKWGNPYLDRDFFGLMHERLGDRVLLVMVEDASRPDHPFVAGALNLIGDDTLYGRYWGCIEEHKFLHFECCYYQAIDFAIDNNLGWVEAGAQGPHKIQRGYLPRATYSAHWVRDGGFRRAVEHFLTEERRAVEAEIRILLQRHSPFKEGALDDDPDFQRWHEDKDLTP